MRSLPKTICSFWMLLIMIVLLSCSAVENNQEDLSTIDVELKEKEQLLENPNEKIYKKEFKDLNIDGVGIKDDSITVISTVLVYPEIEASLSTKIKIQLGNGEVIDMCIPVSSESFAVLTAHLFSDEREAVILEMGVPGSNYDAVNLFVWDVCYDNGSLNATERFATLDAEGNRIEYIELDTEKLNVGAMCKGTNIVDVPQLDMQGLTINIWEYNEDEKWHSEQKAIFYDSKGWNQLP